MNWSSLALALTLTLAMISYVWLRKTYLGAGVGNTVELLDIDVDGKPFDRQA